MVSEILFFLAASDEQIGGYTGAVISTTFETGLAKELLEGRDIHLLPAPDLAPIGHISLLGPITLSSISESGTGRPI